VEDARYVVKREELQPLDELEALESKAKGGCSRHESGGCDCGAKHGNHGGDADDDDGYVESEDEDNLQ